MDKHAQTESVSALILSTTGSKRDVSIAGILGSLGRSRDSLRVTSCHTRIVVLTQRFSWMTPEVGTTVSPPGHIRGMHPPAPDDGSPPDDWNYGNYEELWGIMGNYGELWGIMGNDGELWGMMGNYGRIWVEIWGIMGNYGGPMGELWGNYGRIIGIMGKYGGIMGNYGELRGSMGNCG